MYTLSKDVVAKIQRHITSNNHTDVADGRERGTLTYEQFMNKVREQGNKCYICLQTFKYDGGKWCYFFPSADRICDSTSHIIHNIGISCLFCNIREFKKYHFNTVCQKKCGLCDGLNHTYTGDIITKKRLYDSLCNDNTIIREYIRKINKPNEAFGYNLGPLACYRYKIIILDKKLHEDPTDESLLPYRTSLLQMISDIESGANNEESQPNDADAVSFPIDALPFSEQA